MSKKMSLFFAFVGVGLLVCVGISLSNRQPWTALLFVIAAMLEIGCGFFIKARFGNKGSRP